MQRADTLLYAILYKGVEHPQIWVSAEKGVLEPIPLRYGGTTVVKFGESKKLYTDF